MSKRIEKIMDQMKPEFDYMMDEYALTQFIQGYVTGVLTKEKNQVFQTDDEILKAIIEDGIEAYYQSYRKQITEEFNVERSVRRACEILLPSVELAWHKENEKLGRDISELFDRPTAQIER